MSRKFFDKRTIVYIRAEMEKWRQDTLDVAHGTPFAGDIDAGLFIQFLRNLEKEAK